MAGGLLAFAGFFGFLTMAIGGGSGAFAGARFFAFAGAGFFAFAAVGFVVVFFPAAFFVARFAAIDTESIRTDGSARPRDSATRAGVSAATWR